MKFEKNWLERRRPRMDVLRAAWVAVRVVGRVVRVDARGPVPALIKQNKKRV